MMDLLLMVAVMMRVIMIMVVIAAFAPCSAPEESAGASERPAGRVGAP